MAGLLRISLFHAFLLVACMYVQTSESQSVNCPVDFGATTPEAQGNVTRLLVDEKFACGNDICMPIQDSCAHCIGVNVEGLCYSPSDTQALVGIDCKIVNFTINGEVVAGGENICGYHIDVAIPDGPQACRQQTCHSAIGTFYPTFSPTTLSPTRAPTTPSTPSTPSGAAVSSDPLEALRLTLVALIFSLWIAN